MTRVAVLFGGISAEREVSLATGAQVIAALEEKGFGVAPVEVTVAPGSGNDTVLTGPGPDLVGSSPGANLIRTGDGDDKFVAAAAPASFTPTFSR